eukprot:2395047-Rhodomonas_salina.2
MSGTDIAYGATRQRGRAPRTPPGQLRYLPTRCLVLTYAPPMQSPMQFQLPMKCPVLPGLDPVHCKINEKKPQSQFKESAITYTGPMFGYKYPRPAAGTAALKLEETVQDLSGIRVSQRAPRNQMPSMTRVYVVPGMGLLVFDRAVSVRCIAA